MANCITPARIVTPIVLVKSDFKYRSWLSGSAVGVAGCLAMAAIFCLSVRRFGIEAILARPEANVYLRKILRCAKLL